MRLLICVFVGEEEGGYRFVVTVCVGLVNCLCISGKTPLLFCVMCVCCYCHAHCLSLVALICLTCF